MVRQTGWELTEMLLFSPYFVYRNITSIIAVQKYGITRRKTRSAVIQLKPSKFGRNNNLPTI